MSRERDREELRVQLAEPIGELLAAAGAPPGEHLDDEQLIAYHAGGLPAADAEEAQAHLVTCGDCLGRLLELDDLVQADPGAVTADDELEAATAWRALAARLDLDEAAARPAANRPGATEGRGLAPGAEARRAGRGADREPEAGAAPLAGESSESAGDERATAPGARRRRGEPPATRGPALRDAERSPGQHAARRPRRRLRRSPASTGTSRLPRWAAVALAASLLLALGVVFWTLDQRREVSVLQQRLAELSQPQPNAAVLDLFPAGEVRGGPAGPAAVELPAEAAYLTLVLNLPSGAEHASYRLEVRDAEGRTRWTGDGLTASAFGTVRLGWPRGFLPAGDYELRLYGLAGAQPELVERYPLRVPASGGSAPPGAGPAPGEP